MTKIRLQNICIHNFKGTRYLLLNIDGKNTKISGANGSGKTTVYKAYYWCLTGKTLEPNECIQTLDDRNQVIHKIETSVSMTLQIDDSYEMSLERKLVEDWKALGQPNEELKGTKQQRFINDIPLSRDEFNAKINAVCDLEKLLLLTDITKFMSLKMEERRKVLMSAADNIDETELMSPYPALVKATAEKKTVEELKKQTLSTKKRSNDELASIPSQIEAQDRLKSSEDFEALRQEKESVNMKIQDYDSQLQGSAEELQEARMYNEKIQEIENRLGNRKQEWTKEFEKEDSQLRAKIQAATDELSAAQSALRKGESEQQERIAKKAKLLEEFEKERAEWTRVNNMEFDLKELEVCPTCGHRFTDEEKEARKNTAIEAFNKEKSSKLYLFQENAVKLNEQITILTGSINEYHKITKPSLENAAKAKETALSGLKTQQNTLMKSSITDDNKYNAILKELNLARIETPKPALKNKADIEEQKRIAKARYDEVIRLLAGEQQNERIEQEKAKLEKRSNELAQIISDCDNTLYQIQKYRKAKVDAVEDNVNGFFKIARWKFFEKNVSNDDLQEVCICHHNGVDYNSTNGADKINLGIDIVSGLGKALGIDAPIFVDCAESVGAMLQVRNQLITLEHVKDAPFTFNNF